MRNHRNHHRLLVAAAASTFALWVAMFSFVVAQRNSASSITYSSIVIPSAVRSSLSSVEGGDRSSIYSATASMKTPQNGKVVALIGCFEVFYPQLVALGVVLGTATGALISWHKRRGSVWVVGGAAAAVVLFSGMIVGQNLVTGSHSHPTARSCSN